MNIKNIFNFKKVILGLSDKFSWKHLFSLLIIWLTFGLWDLIVLGKIKLFIENWEKVNSPLWAKILDFIIYFPSRWILYFVVILIINLILFSFLKKKHTFWKLVNITNYVMTCGYIIKFILSVFIFFVFFKSFDKLSDNVLSPIFSLYNNSVYIIAIILFIYSLFLKPRIAQINNSSLKN